MRLRLRPLAAVGDALAVTGGPEPLALWHQRLAWDCRDAALDLRVIGAAAIPLPAAEASEPVAGAIARVVRAIAGRGAIALLANPAIALGRERMAFAEGLRLCGIASAADEACWDTLLGLGQPCYGVRDEVVLEVINPRPVSVIAALSFGAFFCHDGLEPLRLDESPTGVAWQLAETAEVNVLGRDGFALARQSGSSGRWEDRGNEGSVRLVMQAGTRSCWSQPRFIAPRREVCGG